MPKLASFDHIRKVCEGKRIVRMERVFFEELGLPGHNEVHLELDNGVTLALTSTGVHVFNVPISEVEVPLGTIIPGEQVMQEKPKSQVQIADFGGLVTRIDPNDVKPGDARIQVNATCITPGELRVRPGLRQVTFEDEEE